MKKFLIQIAIFFAIVAVVDVSLGQLFHYLQTTKAGSRTGNEYYACKKTNEDVIIMGSSRAMHHYVPKIITEKTGMSCFNVGQDGNGIILQYGRWKMISERYAPKLIIYDITTSYDLEENDNMAYISRLKPFCWDTSVKSYVVSLFPMEKIKLYSGMYRYNYWFLEIVANCLSERDFKGEAGYEPKYEHIRSEIVNRPRREKIQSINTDTVKLHYLEQLVKEAQAKGTQVMFVVSPVWRGGIYAPAVYAEVEKMAHHYGIQYLQYMDSEICDDPDCFKDSNHLNDKGARVFTEDLASHIQIPPFNSFNP